MPRKKQKKTKAFDAEDDDDLSQNSDQEEQEQIDQEMIMIDFEARSPCDTDYDTIKLLLQQKHLSNTINFSEFAQIIIEQNNIGNVIYQAIDEEPVILTDSAATTSQDDEDTIFGVISLIDLNKYKSKACVQQLISFLKKEFDNQKNTKLKEFLNDVFNKHKIGYVINERYLNVPAEISIPMFESLLKDLNSTSCAAPTAAAASSSSDIDYWMFLSKSFDSEVEQNQIDYCNPEEEVFKEHSDYVVQLSSTELKDAQIKSYINALFISKNKINDVLTKLKEMIKK